MIFGAGLVMAMNEGAWFPWINIAGLALVGMSLRLCARKTAWRS